MNDAYNKSINIPSRGRLQSTSTSLKDSINGIRRDVLGRVARVVVAKIREFQPKIEEADINVLQPKTVMAANFQTPNVSNKTMDRDTAKGMVTHSAGPLKKRAKKLMSE